MLIIFLSQASLLMINVQETFNKEFNNINKKEVIMTEKTTQAQITLCAELTNQSRIDSVDSKTPEML